MMARVDVAMGFDGRYAPHAANVMASIVRHAPGAKLRFILLQSGVSEDAKQVLQEALEEHALALGKKASLFAAHANRKTVKGSDIKLAGK